MTRYQPALRPIISANGDFRPSSLSTWKKHSARYKLSTKVQLHSKCRRLRLKARALTVQSGLTKADYLHWDKFDENVGEFALQHTSQGTQTTQEEITFRESPLMDEDCFPEDTRESSPAPETSILPEHVQRRHARRRDVLERVERDLQERCVSRNGLLLWEPIEWSREIQPKVRPNAQWNVHIYIYIILFQVSIDRRVFLYCLWRKSSGMVFAMPDFLSAKCWAPLYKRNIVLYGERNK